MFTTSHIIMYVWIIFSLISTVSIILIIKSRIEENNKKKPKIINKLSLEEIKVKWTSDKLREYCQECKNCKDEFSILILELEKTIKIKNKLVNHYTNSSQNKNLNKELDFD